MENADLNKIRHFKGSVADFKNYFDQRAGENTNAFGTPDYQGFNDVHPTRGANKSSHWDDVHEAKKTYKKGDKLKVKLKNGKEFDITFDSYSSNKGIAFGKIDGDRKPFSLDSVVDEANEEKKPRVGHTVKRKQYADDPPDIGLYSKGGRDAIKGTGYSSKEKAEFTIKKLDELMSKGERVWAMSIATTMESRAKKHQHQTDGMRDAMKIFRTWIDKNKKSK